MDSDDILTIIKWVAYYSATIWIFAVFICRKKH